MEGLFDSASNSDIRVQKSVGYSASCRVFLLDEYSMVREGDTIVFNRQAAKKSKG